MGKGFIRRWCSTSIMPNTASGGCFVPLTLELSHALEIIAFFRKLVLDESPFMPAVETVEKVPFRKSIFGKWERNAEKHLVFGVPHNSSATFWRFLSLLWEFFMNIFQTRGFSTVSLGFPKLHQIHTPCSNL